MRYVKAKKVKDDVALKMIKRSNGYCDCIICEFYSKKRKQVTLKKALKLAREKFGKDKIKECFNFSLRRYNGIVYLVTEKRRKEWKK